MSKNPRDKSQDIAPTVAVGKNGLTESVIEEVKRQVVRRKTIKVRLYGESKLGRSEVAKELAERTNTRLVDLRGFTVILTKKRKRL